MYYFKYLNCNKIKEVKYKSLIKQFCSKKCFYENFKNYDILNNKTWSNI